MAGTKVMKLWTAVITAFVALLTALGFTTAAAAAPAHRPANESCEGRDAIFEGLPAWSLPLLWTKPHKKFLPPTMKQRIRAEAHGSSPSCRRLPSLGDDARDLDVAGPHAVGSPGSSHPSHGSPQPAFGAPRPSLRTGTTAVHDAEPAPAPARR
ncbi:DUF6344 domain-containing protein [Streptomyces sp. NPDC002004]